MDKTAVIATLRAHEPELKAAGIAHLALFGSTVRGEDRAGSDVDLVASFDPRRRLSLLDVVGLENRLSDLLGREVDLVEEDSLLAGIRERALKEAVRAF
jgi:uncharacterized protein